MLREDDWAGDLTRSLDGGLKRWLAVQLPAGGLTHLDLSLCYTDDTDTFGYSRAVWAECFVEGRKPGRWSLRPKSDDAVSVAGFGLEVNDVSVVTVQAGVEELEGVCPGAGFAILDVIERALLNTVGAATLGWGDFEAARREEMFDEERDCWIDEYMHKEGVTRAEAEERFEEESDDEDHVTQDLYRDGIPSGAFPSLWNADALARAETSLRDADCRPGLWLACAAALELDALLWPYQGEPPKELGGFPGLRVSESLAFNDHTIPFRDGGDQEVEHPFPLVVRWNEDDWLARFVDDHHHEIANAGVTNDVTWFVGFRPHDPAGADAAVAALVTAVDVLRRVDQLLCCLTPADAPAQPD